MQRQRNGREYSAGVKLTRVKPHDGRAVRSGRRNEYRGSGSRGNEYRGSESRGNEYRGSESRGNENRGSESRGNENRGSESRGNENRGSESRGNENRGSGSRGNESRGSGSRGNEYRGSKSRGNEYRGSGSRGIENRGNEYRGSGSRGNENRRNERRRSEYKRNEDGRCVNKESENRWIAFMALITVVLVFISVRAVYSLISFQKAPDIIGAAQIIPEGMTGLQVPAKNGIVPLADHYGEDAPLVVIDPGHGGIDNGSNVNGVYEQEINMEISRLLADRLEEMGIKTLLLREDNDTTLSLEERVEKAENAGADIYVSIHQNAYDGSDQSVSGLETWYNDRLEDSRRLAQQVHDGAVGKTSAADRGLIETDDLYVVCRTSMPSCLIETGFLTNKAEREALLTKEYQEKLAEGIAEGIDRYFSSRKEEPTAD